eukprot:2657858-Alexandrium_andersonii.AAC.1
MCIRDSHHPDATRESPHLPRYRSSARGARVPVPVVAVRRLTCYVSWHALLRSSGGASSGTSARERGR